MLAMLKPIAPFVEYAINQDYIAEFLCINQDKPEMQCNGKCHLYKEVEKQQDETPVSLQVSLKEYPIGFVKILNLKKKKEFTSIKKENHFYFKNYNYLFSEVVFHPPTV
jgi:hypothetical protein